MKNAHPRINVTSLLAGAFLALATTTFAVDPPPDGGYANQNTAEGEDALFSLNAVGFNNTALGYHALYQLIGGDDNVAVGTNALAVNRSQLNTAVGSGSLAVNNTGDHNTAIGSFSLGQSTTGSENVAVGTNALYQNLTGINNIGIGTSAGLLCKLSNNIMIGNSGNIRDSGAIRIGVQGTQIHAFIAGISGVTVAAGVGVVVDSTGQLGVMSSSARYKDAIKPMDKASEAILALNPVTFHYKKELDPETIPQFGLVAEQVAKVNPDLVARDEQGEPYTVRYEAVNAMLLNEFLKEHRGVQDLKNTVTKQEAMIAQQQKEIAALTAALKAQAVQIQKVSEQLRTQALAPRMVVDN